MTRRGFAPPALAVPAVIGLAFLVVPLAALIGRVLSPLVGGMALLFLFGRNGWLGFTGIQLPFTTPAVVLAQMFVALPFLMLALEGSLRTAGLDYEHTAKSLGPGAGRCCSGSPCRWAHSAWR